VIVAVPAATPLNIPEEDPMDAMVGALLLQLPAEGVQFKVTVEATQISVVPVIEPGLGFKVATLLPVEVHVPFETEAV
jgi:hypothetical protein